MIVWDGSRRFVFVSGGGSPVFNLRFERLGGVGRAYVADAAVVGNELWAVSYGELYTARLPDGELQQERRLPSPVTYSLIAIP